jgi:hypothetical protein
MTDSSEGEAALMSSKDQGPMGRQITRTKNIRLAVLGFGSVILALVLVAAVFAVINYVFIHSALDPLCDDHNECTNDYWTNFGCHSSFVGSDETCEDVCVKPETGSCQIIDSEPVCHGSCVGSCPTNDPIEDGCPILEVNSTLLSMIGDGPNFTDPENPVYSMLSEPFCMFGKCMYMAIFDEYLMDLISYIHEDSPEVVENIIFDAIAAHEPRRKCVSGFSLMGLMNLVFYDCGFLQPGLVEDYSTSEPLMRSALRAPKVRDSLLQLAQRVMAKLPPRFQYHPQSMMKSNGVSNPRRN